MRTFNDIRWSALAALGLLVACSDMTGPDASRRTIGILQIEPGTGAAPARAAGPTGSVVWSHPPGEHFTVPPNVIEAPDTVTLGQSVRVTVYTIGPNGCWRADGLDVAKSAKTFELTAWDRHSGFEVCTQVLSYLPHATNVTFDQAGEWTIRLRGRRVRSDGQADLSITAERTVFVRSG